MTQSPAPMIDPFGRHVTYLRLSVTDRCDLRCRYCMSEHMTFLPRRDLLTLEELDFLASAFIDRGVTRLRITGGEPLVRKDIMGLFENLSRHLQSGALREITLTTNATRLAHFAEGLARVGVRRINVSLDTLDADKFARITRGGRLAAVLAGLEAAKEAGIAIKINAVALKNDNVDELPDMIAWAHAQGFDVTLIEAMPMGDIAEDRFDQYMPLSVVRDGLAARWQLVDSNHRTGGPARYVHVAETGGRLGFITPLTHNFCEGCNRVRVTCTGQLYMCLGQEDEADLRRVLRAYPGDTAMVSSAMDEAIGRKPKGHDFVIDRQGAPAAMARHMSVTGG